MRPDYFGKNLRTLDKGLRANPAKSRPIPLNRRHLNIPPKPYTFKVLYAALWTMAIMFLVSALIFGILSPRIKSAGASEIEKYSVGSSGQFSAKECAQLSKMAGRIVC